MTPEEKEAYIQKLKEGKKEKRRAKWRKWYYSTINYQRKREREKAASFRERFPEIAKQRMTNQHLKRKYGMTLEERNAMLAAQGGCKICRSITPRSRSPGSEGWHVDHCHKTGAIRGILCQPCNHMLGAAQDDPDILINAAHYLRGNQHASSPNQRST